MFYASDLITQYFPWYYLTANHLKMFSLPHWIEFATNGGYPLLAEGETGALSVINVPVLFLFTFPTAINLLYITYSLIAILGMFLFLRQNQISKVGSLLGGLIFILSGFMVTRYFQPSIIFAAAFLPLGHAIIQRSINSKKSLFFLAPLIYLQITAGHLQIALISIISYLTFAALLIFIKKKKLSAILWIFIVIILGIGLSSIQLLPTLKLFEISVRRDWDPMMRFTYSLPPSHLITYLVPNAYGVSKPGDDLGFSQFGGGFWELNLTVWTMPFLLSLLPLVFILRTKNKSIIALYLLWTIFLLISFGGFFKPNWIVAHIPNFPFRAPARFLLSATFAASALAAFGFEELTKKIKMQIKIVIFLLIFTSVVWQQKLQLDNYFIFEQSSKILENLKSTAQFKLTTPLPLENFQSSDSVRLNSDFLRKFKKGAIISFFSVVILLVLRKRRLMN